jgi:nucleoside-triphosphatase THEP1
VEIVLGSFLHALQVPVAGTILAGIGITLLVAGSRVWGMSGLIWRAGVVCAIMKSISPGGVILGPMVGILLEAFALDGALRLLGRNRIGYAVGGILAALMPLAQKIVSLLLVYGTDAVRLYVALFDYSARAFGIPGLSPASLLVAFGVVNTIVGAAAALLGIVVGRQALAVTTVRVRTAGITTPYAPPQPVPAHSFSLPLLLFHGLFLIGGLMVAGAIPWWIATIAVAVYVAAVAAVYPPVRSKLRRPRVWVEFTAIALLSGLLLGELTSTAPGWSWSGLEKGVVMALRGTLVVTGFGAIGIELRNPRIVRWFLRRGMGELAAALDVAFEALPAITVAFGEERKFLRAPLNLLARLVAFARDWLEFIEHAQAVRCRVFIVAGDRGSGKTTLLSRAVDLLRTAGERPAGILAPAVRAGEERSGYDLLDVTTGDIRTLCRRDLPDRGVSAGPFHFDPDAIRAGRGILTRAVEERAGVILIDEVGRLELDGGGWAPALDTLLRTFGGNLLLTVRPSLVERVIERWHMYPSRVWDASTLTPEVLADVLLTLRAATRD